MKNIKHKIWIFNLLTATLFILPGCSDFLDNPLENQTPSVTIDYADMNRMYQPVSGAYASMSKGGFASWVHTFIKTSQSDDIDPRTGYSEVNELIHTYKSGAVIKGFWALDDMWSRYYGTILTCNSALSELGKFEANIAASDEANKKLLARYQAEVRFIRALTHYFVSRSFGNVPILGIESVDPAYLGTVGKSTVEDVRKHVIEEMDFCIANLEDVRPNEATHKGGVTKYTALFLKAKAAMDLAGNDNGSTYWNTVLESTEQIINSNKFSLFPDYYQLWKKPGKLSDESILELQYTDFGNPTGDVVTSGGQVWDNFHLFQAPQNTYGGPINGDGWLIPSDAAVKFLKDRNDAMRMKTTIQLCGVDGRPGTFAVTPDGDTISGNTAGKKYFNGKAYLPKSQMTPGRTDWYGANNNVRVFRYAEALLMNAEVKIRKGQSGDVPLNLVRQRVGLAPLTKATIQQLMDERRAEFICEWWGERFNDLVRTDQAATVLQGFVKGQSEFFPIPQAQEDRNTNLKN
ncbi:RagB/SusD family nutrient uptake outer membrane protein [Dyadobacter sp. 32]|uniref:RagB/SusD family nutrient uptake outer membrane protein n=1 Tax=Dyadobacter sp. 32 TaxID=538966 RepID=UPI0011EE41AC